MMRGVADKTDARAIVLERTVILSGGVLGGLANGISTSLGFFVKPITDDLGFGRQVLGLATGIAFFLNGFSSIGWGAASDKLGAVRVLIAGVVLEFFSLFVTSMARQEGMFYFSIGLEGFSTAALSFGVILGAVAKLVAPARRAHALGFTSSAFSTGMVVLPLIVSTLISAHGWSYALRQLAFASLLMIPFAAAFGVAGHVLRAHHRQAATAAIDDQAGTPSKRPDENSSSLRDALRLAADTRSFKLLVIGFSVCGFQVFFIHVHLPAYIDDCGLPRWVGAAAMSLIGVGNVIGTLISGHLAAKFADHKNRVLSAIYFSRSILFTITLLVPASSTWILIFSFILGVLMIATSPLTTALVDSMFGPEFGSTLMSIVFAGHQTGAFFGAFMGGKIYDHYGSYDPMWLMCIVLGIFAAADHWTISGTPVPVKQQHQRADGNAMRPAIAPSASPETLELVVTSHV